MAITMAPVVDFPPPLFLSTVFGVGIFAWLLTRPSRNLPFPPGPTPDPIIGNIRQLGSGNFEPVFERWGKEYGEFSRRCGEGIGL